ncbi:sensor histidine kinase [Pseudochryseolinea flava]|uniref:sensor histidine kinase n=1 Tax=Pseudochryseolinea flava TaxID=2059302 RepID=UPI001057CFF6|nr:HAMP domain-containing sensor histidine kinase [Pseudochryseolinea flava]
MTRANLKAFIRIKKDSPSRAEYKRLMLTAYLSVTCMAVALAYATLDLLNQVYYAIPAYVVLLCTPMLSLWLLRQQKYKLAKVALMVASNLVVFWVAITDPFETGAFMFFIPVGIGSFAMLAFEDHLTGFVLAAFTSALFLLAFFGDIHPTAITRPTEFYIKISFIINYFISLTIALLALYFLINLNKASELELIQKEDFANQKNAELQKVNDELDRFVYSVSHDLRSPLSSILGLTNLARKTNDREELLQILMMIQGRVNAQDDFIKEIIDYSRNARTETANEPIKVGTLVRETIEALRFNHNADKIQFKQLINDDVIIFSDRIRLTIILNNLIANSIKYHDFSKPIPTIEIGYRSAQNAIYVTDNGIGIATIYQDKIFNMFFRGSDRSTGSGLGLFITREVVEKLGGSIILESTEGKGSTFTVFLPIAEHTVQANS